MDAIYVLLNEIKEENNPLILYCLSMSGLKNLLFHQI